MFQRICSQHQQEVFAGGCKKQVFQSSVHSSQECRGVLRRQFHQRHRAAADTRRATALSESDDLPGQKQQRMTFIFISLLVRSSADIVILFSPFIISILMSLEVTSNRVLYEYIYIVLKLVCVVHTFCEQVFTFIKFNGVYHCTTQKNYSYNIVKRKYFCTNILLDYRIKIISS